MTQVPPQTPRDRVEKGMIAEGWIILQSGQYLNLVDPDPDTITIEDIAHGLSHVCRFAGQCRKFYSVAEHSVHVSRIVPPEAALFGLLHDAAEAFIGDVTKPLKVLLPDYARIEAKMEDVIFRKFFPEMVPIEVRAAVKAADLRMLATEQRVLIRNADTWDSTAGAQPITGLEIPCWTPSVARRVFQRRWLTLTKPEVAR